MERFSSVCWLGGTPSSGKSTVTGILSDRYGMHVYHCDEHVKSHSRHRGNQQGRTKSDLFLSPIRELRRGSLEWYRLDFMQILEDLKEFETSRSMIVEGVSMPNYVAEAAGVE